MNALGVWSSTLFRKFRRLQDEPPFLVAQTLLGKVPGKPLRIARFYQLVLTVLPQRNLRGFGHLRKGVREDIAGLCALENKWDVFRQRFSDGESCVVACDRERIVGYMWFSNKDFHVEERFRYRMPIPADAIYAYDAYIDPAFRMRGVWLLFQKYLIEQALRLRRSKIMVIVDYGNTPSLKAHLRFGYRIEKEVTFTKVLNKGFFRERTADGEQLALVLRGNR